MNWYSVFYWLTVADSLKKFFDITSNIFTWIAVLSFIVMVVLIFIGRAIIADQKLTKKEEDDVNPDYRSWRSATKMVSWIFYSTLVLSLATWAGWVLCPTKNDALLIIAGGAVGDFITSDSSARQIPAEAMILLRTEIKSEILKVKESAINGAKAQVDSITFEQKVANMTKEELVQYYKSHYKNDSKQ